MSDFSDDNFNTVIGCIYKTILIHEIIIIKKKNNNEITYKC